MQNQQFRAPAREKTIQDYPQLKLTAPKTGAMERQPSMMLYVHQNVQTPSNSEVRMVVFTQSGDQDKMKSKIEVKMGLLDGISLLKVVEEVANSKEEKVEPIVAQTYRPKDFKNRGAGNIEDVKIVVGKNENGVFMSMVSWNNEVPRIRFFFGFGDMFEFVTNADKNQPFSKFSAIRALAYVETLKDYMKDEMKRVWKPWVAPDKQGGGNNNYQSNQTVHDDGDLDDIFG